MNESLKKIEQDLKVLLTKIFDFITECGQVDYYIERETGTVGLSIYSELRGKIQKAVEPLAKLSDEWHNSGLPEERDLDSLGSQLSMLSKVLKEYVVTLPDVLGDSDLKDAYDNLQVKYKEISESTNALINSVQAYQERDVVSGGGFGKKQVEEPIIYKFNAGKYRSP